MTLCGSLRAVAVPVLLLLAGSSELLGAAPAGDDWLRGSGKNLEIRLKGEVFQSEGHAATGLNVTGRMSTAGVGRPLAPTVDGHRFEVWIPVNQFRWHALGLRATSADGKQVAYRQLNASEVRQAAVDGIKMMLQPPTRQVEVKVVEGGQPVPGAMVKAELGVGVELQSRTEADGIARFHLLPQQALRQLTAWTDDCRIGGFGFGRKPTRDPAADTQVVELSKCRDQKLRFIDEGGSPVASIGFVLYVATAPPDYNFLGTTEHSSMTTDAAGEVVYRWFPDWEKHFFNANLTTDQWVLDGDHETVDGVVVFKVKKAKPRKSWQGRVVSTATGAGGFRVALESFQGEREDYPDALSTFTSADGSFSVDVLPDATYCVYALDARWVSEIVDLIPYPSEADTPAPFELPVLEGQEVEAIATSGPQKKPYPNLGIHFRREYEYTWREDGGTRHGTGGPQWWAMTDASGRATTRTLPGKLKARVFTPVWRTEETVEVGKGKVTTIRLHREIEEKRRVAGRLLLADGLQANLANAEIRVGAVDGKYDDEQTLKAGNDSTFSFETPAAKIGIFACTQDGLAAGSIVVKDMESPVELHLRPTMDYQGQLLGKGDQPLAGHDVAAIIRVQGNEDDRGLFLKSFEARRLQAKTDEQGNFTLRGVPSEMRVHIAAAALDNPKDLTNLDEVYLEPGESRPRAVSRLAKTSRSTTSPPLAERYQRTLRDCSLQGFHPMVILAGGQQATEFANRNFLDYETNKDVYSFVQIVVSCTQESLASADAAFLKERDWPLPGENHVCAVAFDSQGNKLGRADLDITDKKAIDEAAAFVHQHAPARADAEKKWEEAFAEAKRSNRRVWARVSQRYCGPCFRLARWMDEHHEVMEKDYVMLKIDGVRDENGHRVAEQLTRGRSQGVPFHAIFDADGTMLIDSESPLGNVGYPNGFEGKKHLRKMLLGTRQNMNDAEIEQLVESLED